MYHCKVKITWTLSSTHSHGIRNSLHKLGLARYLFVKSVLGDQHLQDNHWPVWTIFSRVAGTFSKAKITNIIIIMREQMAGVCGHICLVKLLIKATFRDKCDLWENLTDSEWVAEVRVLLYRLPEPTVNKL